MHKQMSLNFEKEKLTTLSEDRTGFKLPVQVFRQGKRIVYRGVMSFSDVKKYLTHTQEKPKTNDLLLKDIESLTNRYLNISKGKELLKYIEENEEDFILPSLTVMTKEEFNFNIIYPPINKIQEVFGSELDIYCLKHRIFDVIAQFNGVIFGEIIISPDMIDSTTNIIFETGDGNHRTFAIHKIDEILGNDNPGFFIGVDFYVEKQKDKIRDIFIDLNNQTPIDRSIYTLLRGKNPLSMASRDLVGIDKKTYMINHLHCNDPFYIGFSPIDNIGANSKATISFNMLKNIVSYMSLGMGDADKAFLNKFGNSNSSYSRLMREIKLYWTTVFNEFDSFKVIKGNLEEIPQLINKYISLSGAGLYVIAKIGYIAREKNLDLKKVALALSNLDCSRKTNNILNPIFTGGILNENGKVSNNRSSIDATTSKILNLINIEI